MILFLLILGVILGIVFSVATFPGAVWCIQITLQRGWSRGLAAGLGIALAQGFWAVVAAAILFSTVSFSLKYDWLFRIVAAFVLFYMSFTAISAEPASTLQYDGPLKGVGTIFRHTFWTAFSMPMRLLGYLSYFTAVSLHLFPHLRPYRIIHTLFLGAGVGLGSFAWWFYLAGLAALFGKRVPEPITLKSMNKLRRLAGLIFFLLMLMDTLPLVPGFK